MNGNATHLVSLWEMNSSVQINSNFINCIFSGNLCADALGVGINLHILSKVCEMYYDGTYHHSWR